MTRMWRVTLIGALLVAACQDSTAPPVGAGPLASANSTTTKPPADSTKRPPPSGNAVNPSGYIVSW